MKNNIIICFDEELSTDNISSLYKQCQNAINNSNKNILLDGSKTNKISTAAIQIILSFIETAKKKNRQWQWLKISPSLKDTCNLLGLSKQFSLENDSAIIAIQ